MKNMYNYNDFRSKRTKINENLEEQIEQVEEVNEEVEEESTEEVNEEVNETDEEEKIIESAQLYDDTWKVRTRVEIPSSLINAYVKKVQNESGEDPRKKWSEQEIAEEITKFVTSSYLNIENLPVSIVSSIEKEPQVQTQEEMPEETQIQAQVQEPQVQEPQVQVQVETQPQSEETAQSIPQSQPPQSQEI